MKDYTNNDIKLTKDIKFIYLRKNGNTILKKEEKKGGGRKKKRKQNFKRFLQCKVKPYILADTK